MKNQLKPLLALMKADDNETRVPITQTKGTRMQIAVANSQSYT